MRFVYLSEGKLFLKEDGREVESLESTFAREHEDRAEQRAARHRWKDGDPENQEPLAGRSVWGKQAHGGAGRAGAPVVQHVTAGRTTDELVYALRLTASTGVFSYDLRTKEERRLFHRQDFFCAGLGGDPQAGEILLASADRVGLAQLEAIDAAGYRRGPLTEGDARDAFPAPDLHRPGGIVFQSAGAGRDAEGHVLMFGPAAIHRLDRTSGRLETLVEDEQHDHLAPRMDAAGHLYFIRRPYGRDRASAWEHLKAALLFPWRLLRAVFGFLDAFTRLFARESLRPAGGPEVPDARRRQVLLYDTAVRLEQAIKRHEAGDENASLVPASWELVRRAPDGLEEIVATRVATYALGPQGELIYSNGFKVWQHRRGEAPRLLHRGAIVQALVVA